MTVLRMYDSLGYAKTLIKRGVDQKTAEAIAETNQEYYETFINDLATKDFVRNEIQSLKIWIGGVAVVMTGALATIIKLLG